MSQVEKDLTNIKNKLLEQIEKTYPKEQADEFKDKINKMNDEEFVSFLKTQGLIKGENEDQNCIFCSMVKGEIPTTKMGENPSTIAILELNPISKGHTIIIPKKHIEDIKNFPEESKKLAEEIAKKVEQAYKPQKIDFVPTQVMNHQILNLIPVYSNETIDSPREKQTPEGLKKIKEQIEDLQIKTIEPPKIKKIEEEKPSEESQEINEKNTWLPKRMLP